MWVSWLARLVVMQDWDVSVRLFMFIGHFIFCVIVAWEWHMLGSCHHLLLILNFLPRPACSGRLARSSQHINCQSVKIFRIPSIPLQGWEEADQVFPVSCHSEHCPHVYSSVLVFCLQEPARCFMLLPVCWSHTWYQTILLLTSSVGTKQSLARLLSGVAFTKLYREK